MNARVVAFLFDCKTSVAITPPVFYQTHFKNLTCDQFRRMVNDSRKTPHICIFLVTVGIEVNLVFQKITHEFRLSGERIVSSSNFSNCLFLICSLPFQSQDIKRNDTIFLQHRLQFRYITVEYIYDRRMYEHWEIDLLFL